MKTGSLNLLEPSGPVQACIEIAISLFTKYLKSYKLKSTDLLYTRILLKTELRKIS
jgi:hypothetical protein